MGGVAGALRWSTVIDEASACFDLWGRLDVQATGQLRCPSRYRRLTSDGYENQDNCEVGDDSLSGRAPLAVPCERSAWLIGKYTESKTYAVQTGCSARSGQAMRAGKMICWRGMSPLGVSTVRDKSTYAIMRVRL